MNTYTASTWADLGIASGHIAQEIPTLALRLCETVTGASPAQGLARLMARVLQPVWLSAADLTCVAEEEFNRAPDLVTAALEDLEAITAHNVETGGTVSTWMGNRGFHILVVHRVIHSLWVRGQKTKALALKASLAAQGVDIHPAAIFGRRIFLDHGVGLVVGETAVIGDDVSIWHGVTLGSTLMHHGDRHPKVHSGAILGASSTILGNIVIGQGAIVAAGSLVLGPVPPFTVVAGNPAAAKSGYRHPFGYSPHSSSKVR